MRALLVISLLVSCGRSSFDLTSDASPPSDATEAPAADAAIVVGTRTAPSFVSQVTVGANVNTDHLRATLPDTVAAGHFIVVAVSFDTGGNTVLQSVVDQAGDSFTLMPYDQHGTGGDGNQQWIAYGFAQHTGPIQVTATLSAPFALYMDVRVHELANVDPTDPVDDWATTSGEIGTTPLVTLLTTAPNDLVFGFETTNEGITSPGAGFQMLTSSSTEVTQMGIATTPGAYTMTGVSSGKWTLNTVAFKGALQ